VARHGVGGLLDAGIAAPSKPLTGQGTEALTWCTGPEAELLRWIRAEPRRGRTDDQPRPSTITHQCMEVPRVGRDLAMARNSNYITRLRSAVTGRFVKSSRAKTSPRTTVTERFRRSPRKKKR
jgi:hypothetical protein